jgi:uncharacterized membrane protein YhfC
MEVINMDFLNDLFDVMMAILSLAVLAALPVGYYPLLKRNVDESNWKGLAINSVIFLVLFFAIAFVLENIQNWI